MSNEVVFFFYLRYVLLFSILLNSHNIYISFSFEAAQSNLKLVRNVEWELYMPLQLWKLDFIEE